MAINVTSPITGSAQTGFTSPSFTVAADQSPSLNGKQVIVTAVGGTGLTNVRAHSASAPFTSAFFKPVSYKQLGAVNPVTGALRAVPINTSKHITRHGVSPLSGQPYSVANITTGYNVPAGSDVADPDNIRGMVSLDHGYKAQQSASIGDALVSGSI